MHDVDAPQPGGGEKSAEVGDRPPAHAHDRVGPGEARLAELRPQPHQHVGRLGALGVGHLGAVDLQAVCREGPGDPRGTGLDGGRGHDEHPQHAVPQQAGDAVEHVVPHDDVVGVADRDRRACDGVAHALPPWRSSTTWSATSWTLRPAVSTVQVATSA